MSVEVSIPQVGHLPKGLGRGHHVPGGAPLGNQEIETRHTVRTARSDKQGPAHFVETEPEYAADFFDAVDPVNKKLRYSELSVHEFLPSTRGPCNQPPVPFQDSFREAANHASVKNMSRIGMMTAAVASILSHARAFLLPSTASTGGVPTPPPAPPVQLVPDPQPLVAADGQPSTLSDPAAGAKSAWTLIPALVGAGAAPGSNLRQGSQAVINSDFWPLMLGCVLAMALCVGWEVMP